MSLDTTDSSLDKTYKDTAASPFKIFTLPSDPSDEGWASNVTKVASDLHLFKSIGLSSSNNPLDSLRSDQNHSPVVYDSNFFALIDSLEDIS